MFLEILSVVWFFVTIGTIDYGSVLVLSLGFLLGSIINFVVP